MTAPPGAHTSGGDKPPRAFTQAHRPPATRVDAAVSLFLDVGALARARIAGATASGAVFDEAGLHRYVLWRVWDTARPYLNVIGLNPSTADHEKLDPTCTRCRRRAEELGFGGYVMTNLFSFRSTDPLFLRDVAFPEGDPANMAALRRFALGAGMTIAAWGADGAAWQRGPYVARELLDAGVTLHALGLTRGGHPRHPLYLPNSARPFVWRAPEGVNL